MVLFHRALCIHQVTACQANTAITYACWYAPEHTNCLNVVNKRQISIKIDLLGTKLSWNRFQTQENDQLARFRYDLKHLTPLIIITNIVLNA